MCYKNQNHQKFSLYERLVQIENHKPTELLLRPENGDYPRLRGDKLHKLKKTESAITLLAEEDDITPVYKAFRRFLFSETPQHAGVSMLNEPEEITMALGNTLQAFFENTPINTPAVIKGYLLQKFFNDDFDEVKEYYFEMFPKVNDIKIDVRANKSGGYKFSLAIKESVSDNWILQPKISSGMFRTLVHLIEVSTAPAGSVIVIDEFENSLGINCMPEITDFILDKAIELQFILTSHHPYIIHNMPWKKWQIVSRHDNNVKVTKATDIPALDTASSLDKFTQLINLAEYEEGIA
jgi:predicted ATPase